MWLSSFKLGTVAIDFIESGYLHDSVALERFRFDGQAKWLTKNHII